MTISRNRLEGMMIGDWKGLEISLYVRQECGALQMRLGKKSMMLETDVKPSHVLMSDWVRKQLAMLRDQGFKIQQCYVSEKVFDEIRKEKARYAYSLYNKDNKDLFVGVVSHRARVSAHKGVRGWVMKDESEMIPDEQ